MAVTMKQIAEMAGVSTGTVDRALHNKGRVSPEVSERIIKIANSLGYRPNSVAKSLAIRNKNLKIGVIIHVEKNIFYGDVVSGVEKAAEEIQDFGISVIIRYGSKFDPDIQLSLIDELLNDGINALAIVPINHPAISEKLNALYQSGFPVVLLSIFIEHTDYMAYVGCNYRKTGALAAGLFHLAAKAPANILVIAPNLHMLGHQQRIEGLEEQIKRSYPELTIRSIVELSDNPFKNYEITRNALRQHPDIDFVFCGSSNTIIQAIEEHLSEFPSGLKAVCYDYSEAIERGLRNDLIIATITQNPVEQGYRATMLLFHYLTKNEKPAEKNYYMAHQILLKESVLY